MIILIRKFGLSIRFPPPSVRLGSPSHLRRILRIHLRFPPPPVRLRSPGVLQLAANGILRESSGFTYGSRLSRSAWGAQEPRSAPGTPEDTPRTPRSNFSTILGASAPALLPLPGPSPYAPQKTFKLRKRAFRYPASVWLLVAQF